MISLCRSNPTVKDEMILRRGKQRGIRFLGSNAKLRHSKLTEACFLPNVKDIHFLSHADQAWAAKVADPQSSQM
jgi:hypothetical protein